MKRTKLTLTSCLVICLLLLSACTQMGQPAPLEADTPLDLESQASTTVKKLASPSTVGPNDTFGSALAVSGNFMVIGAPNDLTMNSSNGLYKRGAAYLYQSDTAGKWTFVKRLIASDGITQDYFGNAVAISGDTVVVGAYGKRIDVNNDGVTEGKVGAAYIFQRNQGGTDKWGQVKKLVASDREASDYFASSVAIAGDFVMVGAPYEDHDINGDGTVNAVTERDAGAVYIFQRNRGGTNTWGQLKKLTASDHVGGDYFGNAVALSGSTLVVGAYWETHPIRNGDPNTGIYAGAAYVFQKDQGGTNKWGEVKKLVAGDGAAGQNFGNAVAIDGDLVVIGAELDRRNGKNDLGAVYLFGRNQGGSNRWGQIKKLTAFDAETGRGRFGHAVAVWGNSVIIGAFRDSFDTNGDGTLESIAGSTYLFQKNQGGTNAWGLTRKIVAPDAAATDRFGSSVAISATSLAIGAPFENSKGGGAGSVYVNSDGSSSTNIVSRFNSNAEGWTMFGDATSVTPSYSSTGGVNNGGYIFANDRGLDQVYYFQAPDKFLGNKGAYYGGSLRFYLRQQSAFSNQFDNNDVVLEGGGVTLVYGALSNPGLTFTSYRVPLVAGNWKVGTLSGTTATAAQLRGVLNNLSLLRIRGEFETGNDTGSLDEVVLSTTP